MGEAEGAGVMAGGMRLARRRAEAATLSLGDLARAVARRAWLGVLLVALAAGATLAVETWLVPPAYEARATVRLRDVQGVSRPGQGALDALRGPAPSLQEYEARILSPALLDEVARALGGYGRDALAGMIRARGTRNTNLLTVTVVAGSAAEAERVAQAVVTRFGEQVREAERSRLEGYETSLRARVRELQEREAALRGEPAGGSGLAESEAYYQSRAEEWRRRRADLAAAEVALAGLQAELAVLEEAQPPMPQAVQDRKARIAGKRVEIARQREALARLERELGELAERRLARQAQEAEARAVQAAAGDLLRQLASLRIGLALAGDAPPVEVVSPPRASARPVRPQPVRDAAAAGILAVAAFLFLASALEGARRGAARAGA